MFQMITFFPLAESKKYFKNIDECKKYFRSIIIMTNKYRNIQSQKNLYPNEIESGIRLLRINLEINQDVFKLLGEEKEASLNNLKKEPSSEPLLVS